MRIRTPVIVIAFAVVASATPVAAQQTVSEVLSFLLTNRSIPTGDFVQDARAAAATRDTISTFLLVELATLPVTSSASAFTYRLDRNLGTVVRSSDSFGPFLIEWSLTSGPLRGSLADPSHNVATATQVQPACARIMPSSPELRLRQDR